MFNNTKNVYLELLRIYISKIGVQLHVPESMSGVQKVNFPDWFTAVLTSNTLFLHLHLCNDLNYLNDH